VLCAQYLLKQGQILHFAIHVILFSPSLLVFCQWNFAAFCTPCFFSLSYSVSSQFIKCELGTWRLTAENDPISLVAVAVGCDLLSICRKSHLLGWTLVDAVSPLNPPLWYRWENVLSLEDIFQGKYIYFKNYFVLNDTAAFRMCWDEWWAGM